MNLAECPDSVLGQLFFRQIWQNLDQRGKSFRRSPEAALIEDYLIFLPLYRKCEPYLDGEIDQLVEEALTRSSVFPGEKLACLEYSYLETLDNHTLGYVCISCLQRWYQLDESAEVRKMEIMCSILPLPQISELQPTRKMIMETTRFMSSRLRSMLRSHYLSDHRDLL